MQTSGREHSGHVYAKKVDAQAGGLRVGGSAVNPVCGGTATITGTGTVAVPLKSIASAVACIGQAPASGDTFVTCTWSGSVLTISVWTSADAASTTPTVVNWIAVGS